MPVKPLPLREWVAWSFLDAPAQGTTKPLFYECIDYTHFKRHREMVAHTFLVKALSDEATMAREIVGNRIAQIAGLQTPEPAVVFIPRRTARQVNEARRSEGKYADQRPGRAAGARLFNAGNVVALLEVPEMMVEETIRLYAFDMMALHTDRTVHNPNCATTSEGLIVYDFERCFLGDDDEDEPKEWPTWLGATNGLGPLHMFYTALQDARGVRQIARRVIDAMTDNRLDRCLRDLPRPWREEGRRIVDHVKVVRNHADEFVESVGRSLSR